MSVSRMVVLRPVMSQSVPPTAEPMAPPMKRKETIISRWVLDKLNSFSFFVRFFVRWSKECRVGLKQRSKMYFLGG